MKLSTYWSSKRNIGKNEGETTRKFPNFVFNLRYPELKTVESVMDLHDFEDVASNYDTYLSVMYAKNDKFQNFKEFYLELAKEHGQGGVVDIACGTGAVLLFLAQNGIAVDGTDISQPMVDVASHKAKELGLDLRIVQANMTEFKSSKKYSLAIIARSGFMHLLTPEMQRAALLNIRNCLLPGGVLTLNTFAPHPIIQSEQMKTKPDDYTFRVEYTNKDGRKERISDSITYDPKTQCLYGNWKFETYNDEGAVVQERTRPLKMRQTYRQELLYLAELCGYEVVKIYGNYTKSEEYTGHFVWILRKVE